MNRYTCRGMVLACTMAAFSVGAQAGAPSPTIYAGDEECLYQDICTVLTGDSTLAFSQTLVNALHAAGIQSTGLSPGVLSVGDGLSVSSPLMSLTSMYAPETQQLTITKLGTQGGFTLTLPPEVPNGKKSSAMTGGTITLNNIKVDVMSQGIYATVVGANGVGTYHNQLIWTYSVMTGPATFALAPQDQRSVSLTFSQLAITTAAFDLFAQSLGLTAFAKSSMAAVQDYGVITTNVALGVPEPGSSLLMALGLLGLVSVSRRKLVTVR